MALNRVSKIDEKVKVSNVLISVSDKKNIETLVNGLIRMISKLMHIYLLLN